MTIQSLTDLGLTAPPSRFGRTFQSMQRGLVGRCPRCGEGKLYRAYLKVQPCPKCGNDNTQYPSDDAGPYFTILLVGHIVIAPLLCFSWIWTAPVGWVIGTTLPAIAILTLLLLPRVKGAIVGLLYALKLKGDPSAEALPPVV